MNPAKPAAAYAADARASRAEDPLHAVVLEVVPRVVLARIDGVAERDLPRDHPHPGEPHERLRVEQVTVEVGRR